MSEQCMPCVVQLTHAVEQLRFICDLRADMLAEHDRALVEAAEAVPVSILADLLDLTGTSSACNRVRHARERLSGDIYAAGTGRKNHVPERVSHADTAERLNKLAICEGRKVAAALVYKELVAQRDLELIASARCLPVTTLAELLEITERAVTVAVHRAHKRWQRRTLGSGHRNRLQGCIR